MGTDAVYLNLMLAGVLQVDKNWAPGLRAIVLADALFVLPSEEGSAKVGGYFLCKLNKA